MKSHSIIVLVILLSISGLSQAAENFGGLYKGNIEGNSKRCNLAVSYDLENDSYSFQAYRSDRERRKLADKTDFWMRGRKVIENFNSGYSLYMNTIPSESSSMMNWMIGREAKTYIIRVELNNDMIPKTAKLTSKRSREKVMFNCVNLKKM